MIHSHGPQEVAKALPRDASLQRLFLSSRLWTGLKLILGLQFFGSLGYFIFGRLYAAGILLPKLEEPWGVLDCVYMTVITISTIGYGEVFRIPDGTHYNDFHVVRVYTIILVTIAMIFVAYSVSSATAFARALSVSGNSTANSSPPYRATTSVSRVALRSPSAIAPRRSSPLR